MADRACGSPNRPLLGLDVGSSKVEALWAAVESDEVNVLGAATVFCRATEAGADAERLIQAAAEAVRAATRRTDRDTVHVWVSATGDALGEASLAELLEQAGLVVAGVVPAPVASAEAVLVSDEKSRGVVLVGLGAGSTELAAYGEGELLHSSVIPLGSRSMTDHLALALSLGEETAEWIKTTHGCALEWLVADEETVELPGDPPRTFSRRAVSELLTATLEAVFGEARRRIERAGLLGLSDPTCVLTGGGAKLDGLIEYAEELLGMPTRIGLPRNASGLGHLVAGPEHSTAVGLLRTVAGLWAVPAAGSTSWELLAASEEHACHDLERRS
jgi:cell division ATPase FtsA